MPRYSDIPKIPVTPAFQAILEIFFPEIRIFSSQFQFFSEFLDFESNSDLHGM